METIQPSLTTKKAVATQPTKKAVATQPTKKAVATQPTKKPNTAAPGPDKKVSPDSFTSFPVFGVIVDQVR
jgi:hypothetical protein